MAPGVWPLFWTIVCVLFIGVVLHGTIFVSIEQKALLTRVLSLALAGVALVWGVFHRQTLAAQLRRPGFLQWEAWAALGALAVLLPLNAALSEFFHALEPGREDFYQQFFGSFSTGEVVLYFCLLPAVIEEILFRGLLQHWMQLALSPYKAIIYTSALFALIHVSVVTAPYLFLLGVVLGWSKWRTGSIYPAIAIHFIHNYWVLL
ncbi:MAG: CPBP family intramembrane glutamic endopeptidase [bacterium]